MLALFCFALLLSFPLVFSANTTWDTPLQKHVAFFDRNQDGVVYPWETYQGFRAIGASIPVSAVSAGLIHKALSQKTRPGKPPSLELPIEIANIKLAIHGSDSGAYDEEGRFVQSKFEDIFKHSKSHPDALTEEELNAMIEANKEPNDTQGGLASKAEWKMLFDLTKDKDGLLHKDTIHAVYDGSLFEQMEKQNSASKKKN